MQSINDHPIIWSFTKRLHGLSGPYSIVPIGVFIGFVATFVPWLIRKVRTKTQENTHGVSCNLLTRSSKIALAIHWPR